MGRCALLLAVVLVTAACTPAVRPVSPEVLAAAGDLGFTTDLAHLKVGRAIYVQRCGTCHQLYPTASLDEAGWRNSITEMAPKAHLTLAETADLRTYLLAAQRVR